MSESGETFDRIKGHDPLPRKEGLPVTGEVNVDRLLDDVRFLSTRHMKATHRGRDRTGSGSTSSEHPHRHVSRRGNWRTG